MSDLVIVYHSGPSPIGYTSNSKTDWKMVWHTTETNGMPGYNGGAYTPQLTGQLREYGSKTKVKRVLHQHYNFMTQAGKALVHTSGSGETNTDHAVQIELIATCDENNPNCLYVEDLTDDDFLWLSQVVDYVQSKVPVARRQLGTFKKFDASYGANNGVRFSVNYWDDSSGHCGHQNVPGNVHGDPGLLDLQRILDGSADMPMTPADAELFWNRRFVFDDSLNPGADGTPTHRDAQMDTYLTQTFAKATRAQQNTERILQICEQLLANSGGSNGSTDAQVEQAVRNVMGPLADLQKDLTP